MFYNIICIYIVIRRYFSNSSPAGFVIDIMKFRNFDVINKAILWPSICSLYFSVAQTAGKTQNLPSPVSQPLDGESSHFDIAPRREMHLVQVLFDKNLLIWCWIA